jgi:hypothetical protein
MSGSGLGSSGGSSRPAVPRRAVILPLPNCSDPLSATPNELLYIGRRELRRAERLKSVLNTTTFNRSSHRKRRAPRRIPRQPNGAPLLYEYELTFSSDLDDYDEQFVQESESEYEDSVQSSGSIAALPIAEPYLERKSGRSHFLDHAIRAQPSDPADIPIDDALTFVADLLGQASRVGGSTSRSSVRHSARSRNGQAQSVHTSPVVSGRRPMRTEAE